jgi:hypothetical protein
MTAQARTITHMLIGQKMVVVAPPSGPLHDGARNFVVCCQHGDWTGFLNWQEVLTRIPVMEAHAARTERSDGYFWIEER